MKARTRVTTAIAHIAALLLAISTISLPAGAQDATPASTGLEDLGLPALDVTITGDAYEGLPSTLEAGRYLLTLTATEENEEFGFGSLTFMQPAGMTGQEFLDLLASFQEPAGDASPAADGDGEGGGEDDGYPAFYFESVFAGGADAYPGQAPTQIVLDLTPGEWIAWGAEPGTPWEPVIVEVTGEMPADLPEPETSATLTMGEYVIEVTDGELVSGPQVVRIDNIGAQPHFVGGFLSTVPVTQTDIEAILQADITGTPAATEVNPDEDFIETFWTGAQSMGTSMWIVVDLEPGTHILVCFFPDMSDQIPHAYHGMYNIVEVAQ